MKCIKEAVYSRLQETGHYGGGLKTVGINDVMDGKKKIFICTNDKQILGAKVSKYTIEKNSAQEDISVCILNTDEGSELDRLVGQPYLRGGEVHFFSASDLQSWTLIRFSPPELMGYQGRTIVIDPDVFSVGADLNELFEMDMQGKAIMAKPGKGDKNWASSVMVLDCAKLRHWSLKSIVDGLLARELDYREVMDLRDEISIVGELGEEWNRYDRIDHETKLLHTTNRLTQPWRTGLKVDMVMGRPKPLLGLIPREWVHKLLGRGNPKIHEEHPDEQVTQFFFSNLKESLESGSIKAEEINQAIDSDQIRPDAWELLDKFGR